MMELWIRSQDKEKLIKVNCLKMVDRSIYGYYEKELDIELLAEYKTKERTSEVLNEIHQRLIDLQTIEIEPGFASITKRCIDIVYEMPEK